MTGQPLLDEAGRSRLIAAAVFVPLLVLLLTSAWLRPNPAGMGTHTQLGLMPCGFLMATGLPCATCGMTTAFAHAADGHLLASFRTQPAGMLLALASAIGLLISGYALVAGVSLVPLGRLLWRRGVIVVAVGVLLAAWGYKISMVWGG